MQFPELQNWQLPRFDFVCWQYSWHMPRRVNENRASGRHRMTSAERWAATDPWLTVSQGSMPAKQGLSAMRKPAGSVKAPLYGKASIAPGFA
jgi:hypothetical protein